MASASAQFLARLASRRLGDQGLDPSAPSHGGGLLGLEGVGVGQQLQAQDLVEAVQRRPLGGVVHAGLEHIVQGGDPQRGVEIVAHRLKEVVLEPLHGPLVHSSPPLRAATRATSLS